MYYYYVTIPKVSDRSPAWPSVHRLAIAKEFTFYYSSQRLHDVHHHPRKSGNSRKQLVGTKVVFEVRWEEGGFQSPRLQSIASLTSSYPPSLDLFSTLFRKYTMAKSIRSKSKRKARAEFRATIGDVRSNYVSQNFENLFLKLTSFGFSCLI